MEYQPATSDQYKWIPRCSCLSQIKFQTVFKLEQTSLPMEPHLFLHHGVLVPFNIISPRILYTAAMIQVLCMIPVFRHEGRHIKNLFLIQGIYP